jgi:conjugal transfer mating pair stabilization protein TraG
MLEVFTVGGGEYIVNVLNAVAAWSGGGGFRSMIQVVFVMGLIYSLLVLAFNFDWRAWLNWFLQATAIYMMLLVPTVTIKVTDRIDPGLAPATVANVPLGLGVMASFTSQFGDWMTRTAETVFVMPDALKMTNNGIIYGARLLEKAQTFQITDPIFRANLDEHFKQCVFYDVLLGFKPMETLTTSNNLWRDIGPGSPARAQKFLARSGTTVTSSIIRCDAAYAALDAQWTAEIDSDLSLFAKGAYPDLLDTIAAQRLRTDLGIVAGSLHGTSTDPYAYLQQVSVMDAFMAARESFSDAGWDAYAAQRADAQARNTYTSIAQQAMTWVPLLGIVLHVVFYAMFLVIFPLFLFPRTGVTTLRGYGMGFFYLASWGPLYVVLHMFVMNRAASAYAAVAPNGPTLLVSNGITNVNNDIATIAGFMMMSVPFIAAGMARGAMSPGRRPGDIAARSGTGCGAGCSRRAHARELCSRQHLFPEPQCEQQQPQQAR